MIEEVIQQIPVDKITCAKQVREHFDEESLAGLAQSLKEGQEQPVRLRQDGTQFVVITGGRRVMAASKAGLATIGAIVERKPLSESAVLLRQLTENIQRESLSPLEMARGIDRLQKSTSWSGTQIATKLGLSNATVTRLLALLSLPEYIQAKVATGEISAGAGYELARVKDTEQQTVLAGQAIGGQLNRDALSGAVKAKRETTVNNTVPLSTRVTAKLNAGRSVTVSAAALNLEKFIEILEELIGRVRQARPKGIALGTFFKILHDQAKQPA